MLNKQKLGLFRYWSLEREFIRHRKESGAPKPWSQDDVFNKHHFCNVRREDDRGTKQRRQVVRKHELEVGDLPIVYAASNLFNYFPSLEMFIDHWKRGSDKWVESLQFWREKGIKVFHVAYVVSTNGKSMDKIEYVKYILDQINPRKVPRTSCRDAYDYLMGVQGLGSFLCGQIIADLKNDRFLVDAPDWYSFSVIGPGSKKGLDIIFNGGTTGSNYQQRILALKDALPDDVNSLNLHNQDLQNCLCEFSKYCRYLNNEDGRRRYYP